MKTIIAGPRDCTLSRDIIPNAVRSSGFNVTMVLCGCALGVDQVGSDWAEGLEIPVQHFPADWEEHGRAAGPIRNRAMVEAADALIAIRYADRETRGTADVIRRAMQRGLPVFVMEVP